MIRVTAGIIERGGKILIAKRKKGKHLEGLWEFPGGRIELNETAEECLVRELFEELGVKVEIRTFVGESKFNYSDKSVCLIGFVVSILSGEILLKEHDESVWVSMEEINNYELAPADIPLVSAYRLNKGLRS